MKDFLRDYLKYKDTRISGPYGPLKILAPAESLLASLTRMFASLTSSSTSSPSTSSLPPSLPTENVCPPPSYKNVCPPPSSKNVCPPPGVEQTWDRYIAILLLGPNIGRFQTYRCVYVVSLTGLSQKILLLSHL